MEQDKNPFPEINILPGRITRVANWIKTVALAGSRTEPCLSEHIQHEDEAQLKIPFER